MRVISVKALRDFYGRHQNAQGPLVVWLKVMEANAAHTFVELKRTFGSVDRVSVKGRELYIFDIGGNKYRLIAAIHYNRQMVFVRHVLTHAQYDTGSWKKSP
jgi:mRNA interferase HigB